MPSVSSAEVEAYLPLVLSLAPKYVDKSGWNHGAEYDDLVQEGLVGVWQTLEAGEYPSALVIEGRMKNWTRTLSRQRGRSQGATTEFTPDGLPLWEGELPFAPEYVDALADHLTDPDQ